MVTEPSLPRAGHLSNRGEATEVHTRILRLALAVEESRSYWEHVDPGAPAAERARFAFEQRWFGGKSMERVRVLLAYCADRYDRFPEALTVLRRWRSMDAPTRLVLCHWHLQLSDPMYRRFTQFLVDRRVPQEARIDRAVTLRWVKSEFRDRWSDATCVQFASKLLSAAAEARIVSPPPDPRTLLFAQVPDLALSYLLYLLRSLRFSGTVIENPYLASVGLTGALLAQRLRSTPGVSFRRMGQLTELEWEHPSLAAWAEAML